MEQKNINEKNSTLKGPSFEGIALEGIVEKVLSDAPPSPLESYDQKKKRLKLQYLKTFNEQVDKLEQAFELIRSSELSFQNFSLTKIASLDEEQFIKTKSAGINLAELFQISDSELDQIFDLGTIYYNNEEYENAESIYMLLTNLNEKDFDFWCGLAMTEQKLGKFELATIFYNFASEINPYELSIHLYTANCLRLMNKKEEAFEILNYLTEALKDDEEFADLKESAENLKKEWELTA